MRVSHVDSMKVGPSTRRGGAIQRWRGADKLGFVKEIAPGLWHWTARHESIGMDVSSYYLVAERVLLDPMIPPPGLEWFEDAGPPEHILLTNRHHDRQAWRLREAFGSEIHCIVNGCHEIADRGPVTAFEFGD